MKEDIEAIAEKFAKEKNIVAEYVGTYDWESKPFCKMEL